MNLQKFINAVYYKYIEFIIVRQLTPNQTKIGFTENSENRRNSLRLCGSESDSIASTNDRTFCWHLA